MSDQSKTKNELWAHEPLPYLVKLRAITSLLDPIERIESVVAYSVLEAMVQAPLQAQAKSRHRYEVIGVEADVRKYFDTLLMRTKAKKIIEDALASR